MKVAALGIPCTDPHATWALLADLPQVDLLVLPELSFLPWLCADRQVWRDRWVAAAEGQELQRLAGLPASVVVGTMATVDGNRSFNDAFVWTAQTGLRTVHRKTFLPDEPGFWEASWYQRGPVEFQAVDTPAGRLGISICTEMWFTQQSYPDVDIVVVPRATPAETTPKWLAGGATLAVCSGAFCVSSNRSEALDGVTMGGTGWIFDPEGVEVGRTDPDQPVVVRDIDLADARAAKHTYPRYVATGHPEFG